MKKYLLIIGVTLTLILGTVSCTNTQSNEPDNIEIKTVTINEVQTTTDQAVDLEGFSFLEKAAAIEVLSTEDDYLVKLSQFDYASKYNSDKPLNKEELERAYDLTVLEYSDDQKKVIAEAMLHIKEKLDPLGVDMPNISFILTSNADEGGAAYTRGTSIVLKSRHIGSKTSKGLEELIVHEMFHVYSRTHKDLRKDMYEVIGYQACEELVIPSELADYMISNPDAPDNNFYIEGLFEGKNYAFIPIIYSSEAYEINSGRSFFETLNDDMLAVTIVDEVAKPIRINDELLIVSKNQIEDFYDKIGMNTDYTYHPEETMADNFSFLVFGDKVKSPWVVEGLKKVICE
ncbi:MAG: hypothetical protein JEZ08_21865 [Clostridiales bacterium]|nr:hypothetical protein [Clostridiales bacterium]